MAFVGSEEVMGIIESLIKDVWNRVFPGSIDKGQSFSRMTYHDAMLRVLVQWFC
jgi:aspartyl-tRNA synthetase